MSKRRRQTAFVTGGTSGMGRAIVARLASQKWDVIFTGRDADRGSEVAERNGARFIHANATDRNAVDFAVAQSIKQFGGPPDLFVSCAAIVFEEPLSRTSDSIFHEVLEVNLSSAFRYSRSFYNEMKVRGSGNIVHVVSDSALIGIHHLPAYSISKAGLLCMSEALAAEAVEHGIRVNAICPGATHPGVQSTPRGFEHHAEDDSRWGPAPSGRHNHSDDIADAVMLLISDEASRLAGVTLRVDGGASAAMRGGTRA